jgi:hypothetical protein
MVQLLLLWDISGEEKKGSVDKKGGICRLEPLLTGSYVSVIVRR